MIMIDGVDWVEKILEEDEDSSQANQPASSQHSVTGLTRGPATDTVIDVG
ncbi:MAG: hypothetical protein QGH40_01960 [bacterium]|jgi:hypothetical protein|nr:hypothetical protein [bacterium]